MSYPAYASFKAIHSRDPTRLTAWLMYWTVMGLFTLVEFVLDTFVFWLPFYYEFKMLFVLWMILPQTQGSIYLYQAIVDPYLTQHEREIDQTLKDIQKQAMAMGMEYIKRGIQFLQNLVFDLYKKSQNQADVSSFSADADMTKQRTGPSPAYTPVTPGHGSAQETPAGSNVQSYFSWMSPKLAAVATMATETISRHIPARPLPQPPVNFAAPTESGLGISEALTAAGKAELDRIRDRLDKTSTSAAAAVASGADTASVSGGSLRNRKISLYDYDSEDSLLTPTVTPVPSAPPHDRQASDSSWASYMGLQRPTAPVLDE
ncbi:hypothetical protein BGZ83_006886 [Gryganskiella cystojenkinii]|nr:hypothetical protein BGZ83_006886 [Gryganskiella cystojenkinii]